jgi:hypothetical protein
MYFVYPKFSRYDLYLFRVHDSKGIGNLLFVWSFALILASSLSAKLVNPTWSILRPGAFLRGERNRSYFFLFNHLPASITGIKRILLLLFSKKHHLTFGQFPHLLSSSFSRRTIFVVSGRSDFSVDIHMFHLLSSYRQLISNNFYRLLHPDTLTKSHINFTGSITLHVRLGDFKVSNSQTSIHWYITILNQLLNHLSYHPNIFIFSDGSDSELSPLLALCNTQRVDLDNPLSELAALSRSSILLAAADSTFSMWASFLGQCPTIWPEHTKGLKSDYYKLNPNSYFSDEEGLTDNDVLQLLT